jgi:hypothetical protein
MMADWSRLENEAIVADYLDMLELELRGEPFNKTEHRRQLAPLLNNRSDGSIEFKHANISAALIELGYAYIDGYQPRYNYQDALLLVVEEHLATRPALAELMRMKATESATVPSVEDILARMEAPPMPRAPLRDRVHGGRQRKGVRVDFLALETANADLGKAGEEFVVNFERARLIHAGNGKLADRVEHVSLTQGDGLGFDVRSFEATGVDLLIEVKTTKLGKYWPFFVTKTELMVSREEADVYQLYRLFGFRSDPRLFSLPGALDKTCDLDPIRYQAAVA